MKDLIWTAIIIWLIFKVVSIFQNLASKQKKENTIQSSETTHKSNKRNSNEVLDKEGDYVDFEELK